MEEKLSPELNGDTGPLKDTRGNQIKPQQRKLHDTAVSFEEYHYYALKTREFEKQPDSEEFVTQKSTLKDAFLHRKPAARRPSTNVNFSDQSKRIEISDEEWIDASRALRTATWGHAST